MPTQAMTDEEVGFWGDMHFHAIGEAKALPNHSELQLFELIKNDLERPAGMEQFRYEMLVASAVQEGWRAARYPEDTQRYVNEVAEAKRKAAQRRMGVQS